RLSTFGLALCRMLAAPRGRYPASPGPRRPIRFPARTEGEDDRSFGSFPRSLFAARSGPVGLFIRRSPALAAPLATLVGRHRAHLGHVQDRRRRVVAARRTGDLGAPPHAAERAEPTSEPQARVVGASRRTPGHHRVDRRRRGATLLPAGEAPADPDRLR